MKTTDSVIREKFEDKFGMCFQPFGEKLDEALEYAKECLEGRTPDMPIKITPVEMTEAQFSQLPEFEG